MAVISSERQITGDLYLSQATVDCNDPVLVLGRQEMEHYENRLKSGVPWLVMDFSRYRPFDILADDYGAP